MKNANDTNQNKKQLPAQKGTAKRIDDENRDAESSVCWCLKDELSCWGDSPHHPDNEPSGSELKKQHTQ